MEKLNKLEIDQPELSGKIKTLDKKVGGIAIAITVNSLAILVSD